MGDDGGHEEVEVMIVAVKEVVEEEAEEVMMVLEVKMVVEKEVVYLGLMMVVMKCWRRWWRWRWWWRGWCCQCD